MDENLEKMLNNFVGKDVNVWQYGCVVMPVLLFEDFQWGYEEYENLDEFLVLYNGENKLLINKDEIHTVTSNELLNEVIIFMNNESLLQIWCDI